MPATPATTGLEGRELGGCRLISRLGAGGMGVVYLAEQPRLGNRLVAVKIVRTADTVRSQGEVASAEARFTREGHLLAQLSHPNILPVYDSGVQDDLLYLVMQYAPDGSLADAMRGRSSRRLDLPVPLPLAAGLLGEVAAALQHTHEHGIVHRDVKPANVLVQVQPSGQWHLMLADFGVARDTESTARMHQATGTIPYMAPEQFAGKFSPASDQYALGVMAYHLLAGHPPFRGEVAAVVRAHLYDPPPSLQALNPAVTPDVEHVIGRALAKDPADRYPTVAAFAAALSDAALAAAPTAPVTGMAADPAATRPAQTGGNAGTGLAAAAPLAAAPAQSEAGGGESTIAMGTARPPAGAAPAFPPVAAQRERQRRGSVLLGFAALLLLALALVGAAFKLLGAPGGGQPSARHPQPTNVPGSSVATPTNTAAPGAPTNAARLISTAAPASVQPGQSFTFSATYANTGSGTWSDGAGYALVCDTSAHPDTNCMGASSAGMGGASAAPGQQFTFTVPLTAPTAPGTYKMWWTLAQNGTPIGAPDAFTKVKVQPAPRPTAAPTPAPTSPPAPTPAPLPKPTPTPAPSGAATATPSAVATPTASASGASPTSTQQTPVTSPIRPPAGQTSPSPNAQHSSAGKTRRP